MVDRKEQVFERDGVSRRFSGGRVAGTVDQSRSESTTRQQQRIDSGPVIATVRGVHFGSATEFCCHPEQRGLQQATLGEVGDQSRNGMVQRGHLIETVLFDIHVRIPCAIGHRHEPRPRLDEPAREDQSLGQPLRMKLVVRSSQAHDIAAVELEGLFGFTVERKGPLGLRRREQRVGPLVEVVHRVERGGISLQLADALFDDLASRPSSAEAFGGNTFGDRKISHLEAALSGVGVEIERPERAAEKTGRPREAVVVRDRNVRRQITATSQFMRDDRTHLRKVDDGGRRVAGEEVISRQLVIGDAPHHATDHGDLIGNGSGLRKIVAEDITVFCLHDAERTAVLNGSFRLGVERLLLRHASPQMELDHAQRFGLKLLGSRRRKGVFASCFQTQHVAQRQAKCPDDTGLNRLAS